MTVKEMTKIFKRICNIYEDNYCNGCPLLPLNFGDGSADDCLNAMIQFPDEFEQELLKWAKENPALTHRDKFFEVFGISSYPPEDGDWWDEEYIEPERTEE